MKIKLLKPAILLLTVSMSYSFASGQDKPSEVVAGIPVNYDQ